MPPRAAMSSRGRPDRDQNFRRSRSPFERKSAPACAYDRAFLKATGKLPFESAGGRERRRRGGPQCRCVLHLPHRRENTCITTMRTLLPLCHLREPIRERWQVPPVPGGCAKSDAHILSQEKSAQAVDFYNFANSLGEVVRELHSIYSSAGSSR